MMWPFFTYTYIYIFSTLKTIKLSHCLKLTLSATSIHSLLLTPLSIIHSFIHPFLPSLYNHWQRGEEEIGKEEWKEERKDKKNGRSEGRRKEGKEKKKNERKLGWTFFFFFLQLSPFNVYFRQRPLFWVPLFYRLPINDSLLPLPLLPPYIH